MSQQELHDDITAARGLSVDLAAALDNHDTVAITDAYNALELRTTKHPIPINVMAAWVAPAIRARLEDASVNAQHPARSICLSALDLFRGSISQTFDTVVYAGLLDNLQASGIITASERTALDAIATKPNPVDEMTVRCAFWADDGTWRA